MRVAAYGDRAVLIYTDDPLGLRDALVSQVNAGISAVVPAARSVLVEFVGAVADVTGLLAQLDDARAEIEPAETITVPVHYDGADLADIARLAELTVAEVIQRHADAEYLVQFCGFSPGFGYLSGLDERLRVPRLATPRAQVPAGAVAIADEYTGIYPRSSPGGWRLLGRTTTVLFDLKRDPPALLAPGRRVRFIPQ